MNKETLIGLLNADLQNEFKHLHFYLHSALIIQGLHREELREYLLEHAASELKHCEQFGSLIVGMGGKPSHTAAEFPTDLVHPQDIMEYALKMEDEVVANYVQRMNDAMALGGVDGRWVEIFLEDQIMDSRADADNLREMVKEISY